MRMKLTTFCSVLVLSLPVYAADWAIGVGASLNTSATLHFNQVTVSTGVGSYIVEMQAEDVASIELEARNMDQQSWGFIGGLTYDFERKFTGGRITGFGGTVTLGSTDPAKLKTSVLSANAAYRWENFYLPFGLNYSFVKYTPPASFTGEVSVGGGLGGQLGVGYYISDSIVLEATSRAVLVKLKSTSSSGDVDYGTGYLSSLLLTGKMLF
jgi:hypothetical protein